MFKVKKVIFIVCLMSMFILAAGCSNSSEENSENLRKRRSDSKVTSSTKGTLPPIATGDTISNTQVPSGVAMPLLSPDQISQVWTSQALCSLVSPSKAQSILAMTSQPIPEFIFTKLSGAKCSYRSAGGEEIFFEISVSSFDDARKIDKALMVQSKDIVINGVSGVEKSNRAFGTTVELNYSGGSSNQWTVNAPTKKQATQLAANLIDQLNSRK